MDRDYHITEDYMSYWTVADKPTGSRVTLSEEEKARVDAAMNEFEEVQTLLWSKVAE